MLATNQQLNVLEHLTVHAGSRRVGLQKDPRFIRHLLTDEIPPLVLGMMDLIGLDETVPLDRIARLQIIRRDGLRVTKSKWPVSYRPA
jgi:hypothetical protein